MRCLERKAVGWNYLTLKLRDTKEGDKKLLPPEAGGKHFFCFSKR